MELVVLGALIVALLILVFTYNLAVVAGLTTFEANITIEEILEEEGLSHD